MSAAPGAAPPRHIMPAETERVLVALQDALKTNCAADTPSNGVILRLMEPLQDVYVRWGHAEINRGSDHEDVWLAVVGLVGWITAQIVMSVPEDERAAQYTEFVANAQIHAQQLIGLGDSHVIRTRAQEGGTA